MLETSIAAVPLKNPVITASGTFGFGHEFQPYFNLSRLGGISSKGLTLNERYGNEGERIYETKSGLINSIGLQNPGVDFFIHHELPFMKGLGTAVIANLGGGSMEEYLGGIEKLNATDVDIIELNISCPNVKHGGMAFGIQTETAYQVVKEVRRVCRKPLMVKLSPNAENIVQMAVRCEEAGADAISLVNTFKAMAIDIKTKKPVFKNVFAGLSGPAIKPIALRMVYEVAAAVSVDVVGMGGISCWQDAVEFILAGAKAVQVGTANFIRPNICLEIIDGIEAYMINEGIRSLEQIRGVAHTA